MTTPNDDGQAAIERERAMVLCDDSGRVGIRLSMDDLAPADLLEVTALDAAAFDAELDEWETMTWADDVPIVCSVENENPESCDSCQ